MTVTEIQAFAQAGWLPYQVIRQGVLSILYLPVKIAVGEPRIEGLASRLRMAKGVDRPLVSPD